jgi:putative transposase
LPKLLCRQVSQELVERLRVLLNAHRQEEQANVFVLDGSSLELEHSPQLLHRYPPAPNQYGQSHWPVLRLIVMHDAETGLAQQPCWGAMFGPEAVSEQELAEKAMDALPERSVILGDRNFGIFSLAYTAQQRGIGVVLRLTDVRARKLAGAISQAGAYRLVWKPSRWDGGTRRDWPAEAGLEGRLIAARVGRGKSQRWLYLFTTLELSVDEIVALYGRRWNIETDLRSLKRTVRLHHINAKSEATMEKEILMAVSAYNLVRAVMCLAARRSRLDPRQLSFSHVLNVVEAAWPKLINAPGKQQHDQEFFKVLDLAAQCTLPKRHKWRSFPRLQWRRGGSPRFRKEEN